MVDFIYTQEDIVKLIKEFIENLESLNVTNVSVRKKKQMIKDWKKRIVPLKILRSQI